MNRTHRITAATMALCALLAGCSVDRPADTSTPVTGQSRASTGTSTGSTATADETAGCGWGAITPTRISIPARDVDSDVESRGMDGRNIPAPDEGRMMDAAWWNEGPQPGSDQGHVITSAHMFYGDIALGNILADNLQPGDLIRVSDNTGKTVCYRYTHTIEIAAATYDESSTEWINPDADPKLTVMICWDYRPATGVWAKRHIFFADPVR